MARNRMSTFISDTKIDLSQYRELLILDLSSNLFREFPIEILDFTVLQQLLMLNNKIRSLPDQFYFKSRLTKTLKLFVLNGNPLEVLDEGISKYSQL